MFGHQDDVHHHHDGDSQPMNDIMTAPAVENVINTAEQGGTTVHDDQAFNPALPPQDMGAPAVAPVTDDSVAAPVEASAPAASNDLLEIKQQALQSLSPLVGHLDQTPEEKFRTTMMLIQASDNQEMIRVAYEAAQAIEDEKVKAQALLDVVNEINYFTQQAA